MYHSYLAMSLIIIAISLAVRHRQQIRVLESNIRGFSGQDLSARDIMMMLRRLKKEGEPRRRL